MRTRAVPILLFAIGAAYFMLLAYASCHVDVAGETWWVLNDDIMISQRYSANVADGHGPVYNVGERVEGYSNPAVVFLYGAPLEAAGVPPRLFGLAYALVNAVWHGLILLLLVYAGMPRGAPTAWGLLLGLVYLVSPLHGQFTSAGFSVYLQSLVLLLLLHRLARGGWSFYALLAFLPLIHSILYPVWAGFFAVRLVVGRREWRKEAACLALAALPLAAYFVFRLVYFGELFPNTYYLKAGGFSQVNAGLAYISQFAKYTAPLLAGFLVALYFQGRAQALLLGATGAILFVPYVAFIVDVGGDLFGRRVLFFFVPVLLFCLRRFAAPPAGLALKLVAGFVVLQLVLHARGDWRQFSEGFDQPYLAWHKQRIVLGLSFAANAAPADRVALFGLGWAGYLSERPALDMLGKTDRHIARTAAKPFRHVAHQKDDPDYVLRLRPEYIECIYDESQLADRDFLEKERLGSWGYWAALALQPDFAANYAQLHSACGPLPLYRRKDLPGRPWAVVEEVFHPCPDAPSAP
ncbi:MAG: hypothetical protein C4523_16990 [Myxococcales bacterium]|nr:MAG: hypothetical protein C4523_16990 [Myxococcales bacterium]